MGQIKFILPSIEEMVAAFDLEYPDYLPVDKAIIGRLQHISPEFVDRPSAYDYVIDHLDDEFDLGSVDDPKLYDEVFEEMKNLAGDALDHAIPFVDPYIRHMQVDTLLLDVSDVKVLADGSIVVTANTAD